MLRRFNTVVRKRFRKTDINSFLFFLFLAIVIWIFVQFSKQYNEVIDIPVAYTNIPPDKLLIAENPNSVRLRMEDNGFRVAWFSLFPPTLEIDMSKTVAEDGQLVYVIDDHREEIVSQMNIDFDNSSFIKDAITIGFEQRAEKRVPVVSRMEVVYAAGYGAVDGLKLDPDSITISGPDIILDTLQQLYTVPLRLQKVKEDVRGTVRVDTSGIKDITLYRKNLDYSIDVEKFTEGNVLVSIDLINVPEGLNVVIFPKETLLFYQVNLKDYNKVTASDFKVVADFENVRENQDFLLTEIVKKPEFTTNHRLNENRIQFIIRK